jgi:hypothetical protein
MHTDTASTVSVSLRRLLQPPAISAIFSSIVAINYQENFEDTTHRTSYNHCHIAAVPYGPHRNVNHLSTSHEALYEAQRKYGPPAAELWLKQLARIRAELYDD